MKIIMFTIVILLASCFKFAGVEWDNELKSTHWSGYKSTAFNASCLSYKMQGPAYNLNDGRLETFTRLNEEGLRIMETEGCGACHQHGGAPPSILSVMNYRELPAGRHTEEALNCILEKR